MNLLLDTHAWLWFVLGDSRLSMAARAHILDPSNRKFVSPASYWEISIKISLGKYVLNVLMHSSGTRQLPAAASAISPFQRDTRNVCVIYHSIIAIHSTGC